MSWTFGSGQYRLTSFIHYLMAILVHCSLDAWIDAFSRLTMVVISFNAEQKYSSAGVVCPLQILNNFAFVSGKIDFHHC